MKIQYVKRRFKPAALVTIEQANAIIEEYEQQGFDLTLRQLYYQFVSRDLIENSIRSYKNLGSVINDGRLAGLISWKAITDRTRNLQKNAHWSSPSEIVEACASQYTMDKWAEQEHRVEVWIEKDALIGVIENVCRELDVPFFSCRGYTSQSEMWEAGQRLKLYKLKDQSPVIIHLGDHDPSGMDMSRDIEDRLRMFSGDVEVNRIALNMDQVREFNPPPNPAKITDSRSSVYIKRFGRQSWELDALEPKTLEKLIRETVLSYRDEKLWKRAVKVEEQHRELLRETAEEME